MFGPVKSWPDVLLAPSHTAQQPPAARTRSGQQRASQFTEVGAAPDGMTVKSAGAQTLQDYLKALMK